MDPVVQLRDAPVVVDASGIQIDDADVSDHTQVLKESTTYSRTIA